jgi:hypothetical protein
VLAAKPECISLTLAGGRSPCRRVVTG